MNNSYYGQQAGHGQYPPQQGQYPPQGGQYPPGPQHSQYPPQGAQYPQGGQYPPQNSSYPPQSGQYPPPPATGGYAQPSQSPYPPQQQSYNQSQSPLPPHQSHSPYAVQQGAYPPPPQSAYPPPPQAGFGQYGGPQQPIRNPQADADGLRAAMKGAGTNERRVIDILAAVPDESYMQAVQQAYRTAHSRDLVKDLESETSSDFRDAIVAVARGQTVHDCHLLYKATHRVGTTESVLDDVLLGRSNAYIHALRNTYQSIFNRSLVADVRDDLSAKTKDLFVKVIAGARNEEWAPADPQTIQTDVQALWDALEGRSKNKDAVIIILATRSDSQLRAISQQFRQQRNKPLQKKLEKSFSGHMEDALLRIVACAEDRAKADADALELSMKGFGTNEEKLTNRLVRVHWDRQHLDQVKKAYKHFYHKTLESRIEGETSGDYQQLLLALCKT